MITVRTVDQYVQADPEYWKLFLVFVFIGTLFLVLDAILEGEPRRPS